MEPMYLRIFERAKAFLDTRDNELHTRIASAFAEKLLEAEGGDARVVLPAILLHDVGWKMVPEELQLTAFGPGHNDMTINRIHEVEGAKIARRLLEELGYDPKLIDEIVAIILEHDSRLKPLSLNDAIVKDSDKLWRFTAEALQVDPKRFGIDPGVHTRWLKLQIEGWFITETGIRLARQEQRERAIHFGVEDDNKEEI